MACIANCPKRAIEYGNITQGKDAYIFKKYRYVIDNLTSEEHETVKKSL